MSILDSAVSGMLANSNWLSTISQNVANTNSTGYKNVDTEFSALVDQTGGSTSQGDGVTTSTRSLNSLQGGIQGTSTTTDLAVQGAGFFVVTDGSGETFLTRNGSFVPDASGNLVNAAGYYLMALNTAGGSANVSVNTLSGLQKVNVQGAADTAAPSTTGSLAVNLPSTAATVTTLPSANIATSSFTNETTLVAYDNLGGAHTLNVYFSKSSAQGVSPPTWEATVFDASTASANGGFPYTATAASPTVPLTSQTLTFSPTTGALTGGTPVTLTVPGGQLLTLDLSQTTQLATAFGVNAATINGNAPGTLTGTSIGTNGLLSFQYSNGSSQSGYIIPLANVPSPDNLTSSLGDAYQTNGLSGALHISNAGTGGMGSIDSSSLEQSTVDLATELTSMVEAQSSYQANSKVFQTGADILSILNNLKA